MVRSYGNERGNRLSVSSCFRTCEDGAQDLSGMVMSYDNQREMVWVSPLFVI